MNEFSNNILNQNPAIRRPIVKLADRIANQIAAGEVIERPSAIVKELLENSVDAGASSIDVLVSQGGKSIIQVKDNGWGIKKEELPIAVCRHATSKLIDNEISNINTYGFRGEALPSIGSSGRLNIKSKITKSNDAWEILVENDHIGKLRPTSINSGTLVEVRDLFFKTPARLKFLKSDKVELQAIVDIFKKLAIINPNISFSLREISSTGAFRSIANYNCLIIDNLEQKKLTNNQGNEYYLRISQVFGKEISENLLPISFSEENLKIQGYISLPTFSRSNSNLQYFFVNGRPVWDKQLIGSIRAGYSDFIMKNRYPVTIIFINCPNDMVDANVHPAKTQVRFQNFSFIKRSIISVIKSTIAKANTRASTAVSERMMQAFKKDINYSNSIRSTENRPFIEDINLRSNKMDNNLKFEPNFLLSDISSRNYQDEFIQDDLATNKLNEKQHDETFPLGSPVAHIHENYIISQTSNGIIIIDQHAAHERIVYEQLKKSYVDKSITSQALLIPEIVELGDERSSALLEFKNEFEILGVVFEAFGKKSICLRSLPAILGQLNGSAFINDLADELIEHKDLSALEERIENVISKIACHGSVRSGRKLSVSEMFALLRKMEETPYSNQCNHGRPTFIELKLRDIERLFHRN